MESKQNIVTQIGKDVDLAAKVLAGGGLVAIPTETVYGLAANGLDPEAVTRIFAAKNRPFFDPLILHVGSIKQVASIADSIPERAKTLMEKFWPGPLTLVLKRKSVVPDLTTSGLDTVGIRMPDHALTLDLLRKLDFPLAAPSANPFGYISPTTAQHVADQLSGKLEYILDGGSARVGVESTIVSFLGNQPQILRKGGLSIEEIEAVIGPIIIKESSSSNPAAPGMLESHYSPSKKLILGDLNELISEHRDENFAVLAWTDTQNQPGIALSEKGDLAEAAQKLFAALRTLDTGSHDLILVEEVPDIGIGRAVNDRLRRAAHKFG